MRRIFVNEAFSQNARFILKDKRKIHHLKDVLRVRVKDNVVCCDNKGEEYLMLVEKISPEEIVMKKENKILRADNRDCGITVGCAIPKKARMEDIVDKLTQLGVERIIPLKTERAVVKLDKDKEITRISRWKKIAKSASEQSQRGGLPVIDGLKSINEVLNEAENYDVMIISTLAGEKEPINNVLSKPKPQPKPQPQPQPQPKPQPYRILILIGPEGDFTPDEVSLAIKAGCIPASLGDLVLRVDTAAIAVVSYIRLSFLSP